MAERNFDTGSKKGHKFTLAGRDFRVHAGMPLSFLMDIDEDNKVTGKEALEKTLSFIRSMLLDESRIEWDKMLADSSVFVDSDTLTELFKWLIEVASGRPTKRPPSSGNGAGRTLSPSKGPSSGTPARALKNSAAKKPSPSATSTSAK